MPRASKAFVGTATSAPRRGRPTPHPRDARHGDGQYLTDVPPGTLTPAQLSRLFVGHPFAGTRFTHYLEIEVAGLTLRRGRQHVYVVPGDAPLEVRARIVSFGACPPVQTQERP